MRCATTTKSVKTGRYRTGHRVLSGNEGAHHDGDIGSSRAANQGSVASGADRADARRGYERTTVQDILDRADIGRSTFYSHYQNNDDLLVVSCTEYLRAVVHQTRIFSCAKSARCATAARQFVTVTERALCAGGTGQSVGAGGRVSDPEHVDSECAW
jgi:hypothetical protein